MLTKMLRIPVERCGKIVRYQFRTDTCNAVYNNYYAFHKLIRTEHCYTTIRFMFYVGHMKTIHTHTLAYLNATFGYMT